MIVSFLDRENGDSICVPVKVGLYGQQWRMYATWSFGGSMEITHRQWLHHDGKVEQASEREYRAFAEWHAPIDLQNWR